MIVGFDNDEASIFDEQFAFMQEARIPISMTGMLNAVPKTPLHARLKAAGRLIADSVGDQFVFSNIVPTGMSRLDLYEGYRGLSNRLYDYRHYRKRAMALILNRGPSLWSRVLSRRDDLAVVGRITWTASCVRLRAAHGSRSRCVWRQRGAAPARSETRSPLRSCTSISMSTHEQHRSSSTFSSKSFGNRNRAERHQRRRRRRLVEQRQRASRQRSSQWGRVWHTALVLGVPSAHDEPPRVSGELVT
jgi:hypothetical protein